MFKLVFLSKSVKGIGDREKEFFKEFIYKNKNEKFNLHQF